MKEQFILINSDIRLACISHILTLDKETNWVITIKDQEQGRSEAQQRLRWVWFGQMAKELAGVGKGRNKDEWNLYFKHKYLRNILVEEDEDWVPFFDDYDDMLKLLADSPLKKTYMKQFWSDVVKTKELSVKAFSVWLDCIYEETLADYELALTTPADLQIARG